jgi:hypothetical protein
MTGRKKSFIFAFDEGCGSGSALLMEAGFESVFIVKLLIHTSVTCVSSVVADMVDLNRVIFGSWIGSD